MSSFDRRTFLIGALALTAGCGFTPAYGPGGDAETLRGSIAVDDPDDPEGFALVRQLEERLGLPEAPRYALSARISIGRDSIGILPDQTITRFNLLGRVDYALTELGTGTPVTGGQVANFTSFSATSTTVATAAAEQDARDRLMVALADQIVSELLASSGDWLT